MARPPQYSDTTQTIKDTIKGMIDIIKPSLKEYIDNTVNEKFNKLDEKFNKLDEKFNKLDEKFNKLDEKFNKQDEKFNKLDTEIIKIRKSINDVLWGKFAYIEKDYIDLHNKIKNLINIQQIESDKIKKINYIIGKLYKSINK